jgi:hypothetical protein
MFSSLLIGLSSLLLLKTVFAERPERIIGEYAINTIYTCHTL